MKHTEYATATIDVTGFFGGKVDNQELAKILNSYGSKGWMLHSITPVAGTYGTARSLLLTFEREKND